MGKRVCLTFDDGPDPYKTPRVMNILEKVGVKATFFVIGSRVAANPHLVRELAKRGHGIQNHTQTHPELHTLSLDAVRREVGACTFAIASLGLPGPLFFRPPHGFRSAAVDEVAREQGLMCAMWDVDPEDWVDPDPVDLYARVVSGVEDGGVVQEHHAAGGDSTLEALPYVIRDLKVRGLEFGLLDGTGVEEAKSA